MKKKSLKTKTLKPDKFQFNAEITLKLHSRFKAYAKKNKTTMSKLIRDSIEAIVKSKV